MPNRFTTVVIDGEVWTIERLPAADRPVLPVQEGAPRLRDFLTPVASFGGIPVYELPTNPAESEELRNLWMQAQKEWEANNQKQS